MKTLISLILTISSSLALAGGSGGGGVMASAMMSTSGGGVIADGNGAGAMGVTEIVYHMGQQDGLIKFAYARFEKGQWISQQVEFFESDLISDISLMRSLQDSKVLNAWSEIK